jgi:hypothetical protein
MQNKITHPDDLYKIVRMDINLPLRIKNPNPCRKLIIVHELKLIAETILINAPTQTDMIKIIRMEEFINHENIKCLIKRDAIDAYFTNVGPEIRFIFSSLINEKYKGVLVFYDVESGLEFSWAINPKVANSVFRNNKPNFMKNCELFYKFI